MTYNIDLQITVENCYTPSRTKLEQWVTETLLPYKKEAEICIRLVNETESAFLNETYRKKTGPTNILSFPSEIPDDLPLKQSFLGDLVICPSVLENEAQQQNKSLEAHWAHIVIHGLLHLLGYDHVEEKPAEVMEGLEIQILKILGYPNPYEQQGE
ncbi:MAG: rRNA maturation RNase YbeY [Proteobacteria bacterium]|nr:rRNA maturation RNase YbeY [Pseudomonadota bacterium]